MLKPIDVVFLLHLTIVSCMGIYPFIDTLKPYYHQSLTERETFITEALSTCEGYQQNQEKFIKSLEKGNKDNLLTKQEWQEILLCFDQKMGIIKENGKIDIQGAKNYYNLQYDEKIAQKMQECLVDKEYPEKTAENLYKCQVEKIGKINVF